MAAANVIERNLMIDGAKYLLCSSVDVGYSSDVISLLYYDDAVVSCLLCTDERSCGCALLIKRYQGTVLHFCIGT